jgi:predicted extracellular nuclease
MSVRIATFNIENLMNRFDFTGFRNDLTKDRSLSLYHIKDELQYREMEQARMVGLTDDTRQLSALAIADTKADILCLQEVDNIEALKAFEFGYLFKMVGNGYRQKYMIEGNDSRGIDVAVMMREETQDGQTIEFVAMKTHAHMTYAQTGLYTADLGLLGLRDTDKIFKRDCLEVDLLIGGKPLTLFVTHMKSMGGARNGLDGRQSTMPVRNAEAQAIRRIIETKFGRGQIAGKRWLICGDLNDYQEKIVISEDGQGGHSFNPVREEASALDHLLNDGFCENLVTRRDVMDRWTVYHTRGPDERHLCQLDYILASPSLAVSNSGRKPDIIRKGQPWRTIFPKSQEVERYPRTGWDRPKASDHSPVAMTFDMV